MYLGDMDEELQRLSDAMDRTGSVLAEAQAAHEIAARAYFKYAAATHEDLFGEPEPGYRDDEDVPDGDCLG